MRTNTELNATFKVWEFNQLVEATCQAGDMCPRGLDKIGPDIHERLNVCSVTALRLRKMTEDNGAQSPLSFIVVLTGNELKLPFDLGHQMTVPSA